MSRIYYHSPFSPETAAHGSNPALLIQMIVHELIKAKTTLQGGSSQRLIPFDWRFPSSSLERVQEHASLLSYAFPKLQEQALCFEKNLHLDCSELFTLLLPFLECCKESPHLKQFLHRHQNAVPIYNRL